MTNNHMGNSARRRRLAARGDRPNHCDGDAGGPGIVHGVGTTLMLLVLIAAAIWLAIQILDITGEIGAISATVAQVQAPGFSAEAAMAGAAQ